MDTSYLDASFLNGLGEIFVDFPVISSILLGLFFVLRGETAIILATYFVVNGFMSPLTLVLISLIGMIIGDNFAYFVGRFLRGTIFSAWIEKKFPKSQSLQDYFRKHIVKLIFIAKFAIGLTLVTLLFSGWSRVKFKKFFLVHFAAIAIWTVLMGGMSYALITGLGYLQASQIFDKIELGILAMIIIVLGGEYVVSRIVKKVMDKKNGNF